MYYTRQTYTLTDSDKTLIKALAKLLFNREDAAMDLPFIVLDSSSRSPELLKGHKITEGSHFDTETLGYYSPDIFTISLLEEPVSDAARLLNADPDILRSIVLIHEIGHYITQCPMDVLRPGWEDIVKEGEEFWKDNEFMLSGERKYNHIASATIMNESSRKLLETLAQLLTHFVVRDIPEYDEVFKKMTALQTEDYTEFKSYQDIDPWYLFRTMSLVRSIDYTNQTMQLATPTFAKERHLKWLCKG